MDVVVDSMERNSLTIGEAEVVESAVSHANLMGYRGKLGVQEQDRII